MNLISTEQQQLIDRFLHAFKRIEGHLRYELREDITTPFKQLVYDYRDRNPVWGHQAGQTLIVYSELRNALVHESGRDLRYLSVPLLNVVEQIERIRDQLINEEKVIPKFQQTVITVSIADSLDTILTYIHKNEFSQFPVYHQGESFAGLLTENGITRWLAEHTTNEFTLVDFGDVMVEHLLQMEEVRQNHKFISRQETVNVASSYFGRNPFLEALLITHSGKSEEKLLGIITRWDVINTFL